MKAMIAVEGENALYQCDVIQHEGSFWLVPEWLDMPSTGQTTPARIICLDLLRHQRFSASEWTVNDPIPRAVLEGRAPPGSVLGYLVVERPGLILRGGSGLQ